MLILGIKGEGRNFRASCKTKEEMAMFEDVEDPIYESTEQKLVVLNSPLIPQTEENDKDETR